MKAKNIIWQNCRLAIFLVGLLVTITVINPAELFAAGTIYYVSPAGNDTNPGTETEPWKTIQKAANTLTVGDTVYIKAGTYQEIVTPANSGSANNYITYAAYPGHTVMIDGRNKPLPAYESGLFHIENRAYIKVSGLRIINAGPNMNNSGIYVDTSNHIIIEKNYTYNTVSSGIGVWNSNNIIIDGNEVELACNDGEQEDITVAVTNIFEVKNNLVHHGGPGTNGGEGITIKDGSSNGKVYKNIIHNINADRTCIYADAWDKHTYNIEIYQNITHDCGAGISLASENGGLLEHINIYNNIAYHNKVNGLEIGYWGEPGITVRPIRNITFTNNTAYNNGWGGWGGGISFENPDAKNIIVRNNILSQNLTFQLLNEINLSAANLTIDYNLIDGYRSYTSETYGSNYVTGNPMFVNASGADFHLNQNSPAIDKGSAIGTPNDDFDGNARPKDGDGNGIATHDIGAYELTANLTLSVITDPNPVKATTKLITYTITLKNDGAIDVTGLTLTSTIPNSTTYKSGGDSFLFPNVVWNIPALTKNSQVKLSFYVTVTELITDGDRLINAILASSTQDITASIPSNTVTVGVNLNSIYLPTIMKK